MDSEFLGQQESEEKESYLSHEDDELDAHIILLVLLILCQMMCLKKRQRELQLQIERPTRRPITRAGQDYIDNVLKEDPLHFRELYRMYPNIFLKLCNLHREKTSLTDTRYISLEEMVASFLLVVGQNSRYCYTRDTFKRSKFVHSIPQMVTNHYIERRTCNNGNSFNSISRLLPKFWNLFTFFYYKMLTIIPIFKFVKFTKTTCKGMQS